MFADFFQSVYCSAGTDGDNNYLASLQSNDINLPVPYFTIQEIYEKLSAVDPTKGAGPDNIPPAFLKLCAAPLAAPICRVLNRSITERSFPRAWKIAAISPIHKSGNVHSVENYRPISILNSISKIFEVLMHERIYAAVKSLICEAQHGFVKQRSTVTNLMCYVSSLSDCMEKGCQVDSIYIDFAKAFDRVPHKILIEKLDRIGFPDWALDWIASYLNDRHAFTKVNSSRSRTFAIPSGVPQGSHLGPLLFIIFVNDLCATLQSDTLMYADDLKLFRKIVSTVDCLALQADIVSLENWCRMNGMEANAKKSLYDNKPVDVLSSMQDSFARVSQTNEIYTDLSAAFDKVNHKMAIAKLDRIDESFSNRFPASSGVPKGSHLGPIIFLIYFNDVLLILDGPKLAYADDLKLFQPINSPEEDVNVLQSQFNIFAAWCDVNCLPLNRNKCTLRNTLQARRKATRASIVADLLSSRTDCPALLEALQLSVRSLSLRNRDLQLFAPLRQNNYGSTNGFGRLSYSGGSSVKQVKVHSVKNLVTVKVIHLDEVTEEERCNALVSQCGIAIHEASIRLKVVPHNSRTQVALVKLPVLPMYGVWPQGLRLSWFLHTSVDGVLRMITSSRVRVWVCVQTITFKVSLGVRPSGMPWRNYRDRLVVIVTLPGVAV
ncbi:uncharacterized protein LOC129752227 [Uranotaenia lowii]|uniref:uncharacterized protein LOC129752227 n=1 Tax=Uranotaenia lowii TaxID=190385 RepID=UPI00247886BB|nr:uncharacterized protein LOC129752227 [Uranotaenia lowii]